MNSRWLHYPFVRLLFPLAVGIGCGDAFPHFHIEGCYAVGVLFLWIVLAYCFNRLRRLYGLLAHLFLFATGFQVMTYHWTQTAFSFPAEAAVYKVRIGEHPEEKPRSLLCRSVLLECFRHDTLHSYSPSHQFLLYFPKDSLSATLQRGDIVRIYARLTPPVNLGDPKEFDYVRYLRHRGGTGTAYVPAGRWQVVGHDDTRTLLQVALDYREKAVSLYKELGFRGDELAVLSALTIGDKSELSDEIQQTYSTAGAAHILALSGMHIAFLFALVWFVIRPLWNRGRWLRPLLALLIILTLWAFAFFTGLSSSVVRAVVMCSIFTLSKLQMEQPLTLNTLAATAFLMLLFRPEWLFDVGFQLSFTSVAGILLIQPGLSGLWKVQHRLCRYVWSLLTLSMSAQIAVAPLVMLYFHSFSTHFLLTNLLVVPWSSLLLYVAVAMLLFTPLPAAQQGIAAAVEWMVRIQNEFLRWTEQLPFAQLNGLQIDIWDVTLYYAALFALGYALQRRTAGSIQLFLALLLMLVLYHVIAPFCRLA